MKQVAIKCDANSYYKQLKLYKFNDVFYKTKYD